MKLVTERVSIYKMRFDQFLFKRILQIIIFFSIVPNALILISCAPQGKGILGTAGTNSDIVASTVKNSPFAYDVVVDTISYNSCISETVKGSAIHGLMVGGSEGFADPLTGSVRAGLKLRTDFLQYVGKTFKPEYPNTTIVPSQIQSILANSDFNKDASLQIAIRRASDFAAIPDLIAPGGNSTKNYALTPRDLTVFLQTLHSGLLGYNITKGVKFATNGAVLAEGPRVYSLSDAAEPIPIVTTFNLNATTDESEPKPTTTPTTLENYGRAETYAQHVRDEFNSKRQLVTATFGGNENISDTAPIPGAVVNHINILKRPTIGTTASTDKTKAFGRGYQLQFESPNTAQTSWLKTKLTKITELNLDNGAPTGGTSWSCESFVIMKPELWDNNRMYSTTWQKKDTTVEPSCSPIVGPDLTGAEGPLRQAQIKRLRRHYLESQWNIGLYVPAAERTGFVLPARAGLALCLTPKAGECYLPTQGILDADTTKAVDIGIQYDINQECYLTIPGGGDTKRSLGRCAQFASICVRTSSNY